jgi:hypothetical protein
MEQLGGRPVVRLMGTMETIMEQNKGRTDSTLGNSIHMLEDVSMPPPLFFSLALTFHLGPRKGKDH